jgi:hypothetical protein
MSATSVRASGQCDNFPVLSHGGREQERTGLAVEVNFEIILRYLLRPRFHIPRQILFSLLAQQLGRALVEFRIVRQSFEGIPPQKIRADPFFSKPASAKCTGGCQGSSTRLASEIHTTPPTAVRVQPRDNLRSIRQKARCPSGSSRAAERRQRQRKWREPALRFASDRLHRHRKEPCSATPR